MLEETGGNGNNSFRSSSAKHPFLYYHIKASLCNACKNDSLEPGGTVNGH